MLHTCDWHKVRPLHTTGVKCWSEKQTNGTPSGRGAGGLTASCGSVLCGEHHGDPETETRRCRVHLVQVFYLDDVQNGKNEMLRFFSLVLILERKAKKQRGT